MRSLLALSSLPVACIDQDIRALLDARREAVTRLLAANRGTLDRLAEALLRDGTVGSESLGELIGPKAGPSQPPTAAGKPS